MPWNHKSEQPTSTVNEAVDPDDLAVVQDLHVSEGRGRLRCQESKCRGEWCSLLSRVSLRQRAT